MREQTLLNKFYGRPRISKGINPHHIFPGIAVHADLISRETLTRNFHFVDTAYLEEILALKLTGMMENIF